MSSADVLVPEIMSLNDWIEAAIKVESFIKSEEGVKAEDPLDAVRQFLTGKDIDGFLRTADGDSAEAGLTAKRPS